MLKLSPMYREFLLELARQAANHKCKNKTKDTRFNAFFFGYELVTKKIHEKKIRESQRMFSSIQIRRFFGLINIDFFKKNPKFDLDFPYIWKKCLDNDFVFALLSKQGWAKKLFFPIEFGLFHSNTGYQRTTSFSASPPTKKNKRRVKLC